MDRDVIVYKIKFDKLQHGRGIRPGLLVAMLYTGEINGLVNGYVLPGFDEPETGWTAGVLSVLSYDKWVDMV
jgi:hypothetical protein